MQNGGGPQAMQDGAAWRAPMLSVQDSDYATRKSGRGGGVEGGSRVPSGNSTPLASSLLSFPAPRDRAGPVTLMPEWDLSPVYPPSSPPQQQCVGMAAVDDAHEDEEKEARSDALPSTRSPSTSTAAPVAGLTSGSMLPSEAPTRCTSFPSSSVSSQTHEVPLLTTTLASRRPSAPPLLPCPGLVAPSISLNEALVRTRTSSLPPRSVSQPATVLARSPASSIGSPTPLGATAPPRHRLMRYSDPVGGLQDKRDGSGTMGEARRSNSHDAIASDTSVPRRLCFNESMSGVSVGCTDDGGRDEVTLLSQSSAGVMARPFQSSYAERSSVTQGQPFPQKSALPLPLSPNSFRGKPSPAYCLPSFSAASRPATEGTGLAIHSRRLDSSPSVAEVDMDGYALPTHKPPPRSLAAVIPSATQKPYLGSGVRLDAAAECPHHHYSLQQRSYLPLSCTGGGGDGGRPCIVAPPCVPQILPTHDSVFFPRGTEVVAPVLLHYLTIAGWSTKAGGRDFFNHRRLKGGEVAGHTVRWLHTAQPRDRFVFLVTPVTNQEEARQTAEDPRKMATATTTGSTTTPTAPSLSPPSSTSTTASVLRRFPQRPRQLFQALRARIFGEAPWFTFSTDTRVAVAAEEDFRIPSSTTSSDDDGSDAPRGEGHAEGLDGGGEGARLRDAVENSGARHSPSDVDRCRPPRRAGGHSRSPLSPSTESKSRRGSGAARDGENGVSVVPLCSVSPLLVARVSPSRASPENPTSTAASSLTTQPLLLGRLEPSPSPPSASLQRCCPSVVRTAHTFSVPISPVAGSTSTLLLARRAQPSVSHYGPSRLRVASAAAATVAGGKVSRNAYCRGYVWSPQTGTSTIVSTASPLTPRRLPSFSPTVSAPMASLSAAAPGGEDRQSPPAVGVEVVEVAHVDITAMDYLPRLTSHRLSLEAKTVTTLFFSSLVDALSYYRCADMMPLMEEQWAAGMASQVPRPTTTSTAGSRRPPQNHPPHHHNGRKMVQGKSGGSGILATTARLSALPSFEEPLTHDDEQAEDAWLQEPEPMGADSSTRADAWMRSSTPPRRARDEPCTLGATKHSRAASDGTEEEEGKQQVGGAVSPREPLASGTRHRRCCGGGDLYRCHHQQTSSTAAAARLPTPLLTLPEALRSVHSVLTRGPCDSNLCGVATGSAKAPPFRRAAGTTTAAMGFPSIACDCSTDTAAAVRSTPPSPPFLDTVVSCDASSAQERVVARSPYRFPSQSELFSEPASQPLVRPQRTSVHTEVVVSVYTVDPVFNSVLRELLMPEPGSHPYTASTFEQKRMLSMVEVGMPAWVVFYGSTGLPYRSLFRLLYSGLLNLWPLISLAVGLYDLYRHLPQLKRFMAYTFEPLSKWVEQHFTIRVSVLVTYLVSVAVTICSSFTTFVSQLYLFQLLSLPLVQLVLTLVKLPFLLAFDTVWLAMGTCFGVVSFALQLLRMLIIAPLTFVTHVAALRDTFSAAVPAAVEGTSLTITWWRMWLEFWETVASPVKNAIRGWWDSLMHVSTSAARRETSIRRWSSPKLEQLAGFTAEVHECLAINVSMWWCDILIPGLERKVLLAVALVYVYWLFLGIAPELWDEVIYAAGVRRSALTSSVTTRTLHNISTSTTRPTFAAPPSGGAVAGIAQLDADGAAGMRSAKSEMELRCASHEGKGGVHGAFCGAETAAVTLSEGNPAGSPRGGATLSSPARWFASLASTKSDASNLQDTGPSFSPSAASLHGSQPRALTANRSTTVVNTTGSGGGTLAAMPSLKLSTLIAELLLPNLILETVYHLHTVVLRGWYGAVVATVERSPLDNRNGSAAVTTMATAEAAAQGIRDPAAAAAAAAEQIRGACTDGTRATIGDDGWGAVPPARNATPRRHVSSTQVEVPLPRGKFLPDEVDVWTAQRQTAVYRRWGDEAGRETPREPLWRTRPSSETP